MATPWYKGVCDVVLGKVMIWNNQYDKGEIHSTQTRPDPERPGCDKIIVVKRAHKIAWTKPELEHLQRLLADTQEGIIFAEQIENIIKMWEKGTTTFRGQRVFELAFYPEHVQTIVRLLQAAKNAPRLEQVEQNIKKAQQGGKDLFEI